MVQFCFYILVDSGLNELFQMHFFERGYICTNIEHFYFFGPIATRQKKWGNTGSHPKPMSTFSDGNEKGDHKLSNAFYFIEISSKYMFRLNL